MEAAKINNSLANFPMERKSELVRNLMCAVLLTAVKDYCGEITACDRVGIPAYYFEPKQIIEDLKSPLIVSLSDGMSLTIANQLLTNSDRIKDNLTKIVEDFDLMKVNKYETPTFE